QDSGCSGLIGVCSTTAQRGALDWLPQFERVISAAWPEKVVGSNVLQGYSPTNVWPVGEIVRELRPENQAKR
ncbi:hypothetical protein CEE44_00005, partial [Candidatus Woesearchaeota archaeon B3_Woes]